jgi:hypothetical protein
VTNSPFGVTAFADDEDLIDGLIGETSSVLGDACGPMLDPSSPTNSLIYRKVSGTQGTGCQSPMPPGSPGWPDDDLTCLDSWIAGL